MRLVRRILIAIVALVAMGAAAGLGVGGWYLSDILKKDALMPDHEPAELDMQVVSVGEGEITLGVTPETSSTGPWKHDGVWGLRWDGGYGQVGAISQLTDLQVVRSFTPVMGKVQAGSMAQLDSFAFEGDAQTALGIPFREVTYSSPVGLLGAWYVEGGSKTWAIFVHGRNATPREGPTFSGSARTFRGHLAEVIQAPLDEEGLLVGAAAGAIQKAERDGKRVRGANQICKLMEGVYFQDGTAMETTAGIAA